MYSLDSRATRSAATIECCHLPHRRLKSENFGAGPEPLLADVEQQGFGTHSLLNTVSLPCTDTLYCFAKATQKWRGV